LRSAQRGGGSMSRHADAMHPPHLRKAQMSHEHFVLVVEYEFTRKPYYNLFGHMLQKRLRSTIAFGDGSLRYAQRGDGSKSHHAAA